MFTGDHSQRVHVRVAGPADAAVLAQLGAATFSDTFASDNDPRDMSVYLASAFSEAIQRAELEDTRHTVLLAERAGVAVGYAMLREGPAPSCVADRDTIEIARLYAVKQLIGTGIGAALMQRSLEEATSRGRSTVWLGVWEHNVRAIAFYKRWAFADVGSQTFVLGRDRQTDRVLARRVAVH